MRHVWVAALLILLLAWGLTDVRRRARVDEANPAAHRSDVTVYTGAGAAFFDDGVDPYLVSNPRGWHYLYPPLFAIALAPLSHLPGSEQGFVFYLISLLLLYGSVVETSRILSVVQPDLPRTRFALFDDKLPKWIVRLAVAAVLLPLLNCLQRGQVAPFTLYPLLLGTRLLIEKRSWRSWVSGGVVLALPIAIKLTPALPVAFVGWVVWVRVVLGRRSPDIGERLRDAMAISVGVVAGLVIWLLLVPAVFVGWSANLGYLSTWVDRVAANRSFDEENDFFGASRRNQSLQNGVRLFVGTFVDEPGVDETGKAPGKRYRSELNASIPNTRLDRALFAVRVGLILLLLAGGVRLAASGDALSIGAALGLGAIGSVVFSPLSWGHHYGIIWPAVVFVPMLQWKAGNPRMAKVLSISACCLTVAHYALTGPLGSVGMLGIGTAIWYVVVIVTLPRGGVNGAGEVPVGTG